MTIFKSLLISSFIVLTVNILHAQEVEVIGGLKVTSMNEDPTGTEVVIKQANGTLAYRDIESLTSEGIPSSGIILSETPNNTALINAGFTEIGKQSVDFFERTYGAWSSTSTTNAPSGREGHTAVWTGSEMIVWGGEDNSTYKAEGGRYNPTTDTWNILGQSEEPTPRRDHTVIWTGNFMIVWGGNDGTALNSGSGYDYSSDKWAGITTVGAPSGRYNHSAVWTGNKMIVWGGFDGTNFFSDGKIYDPSTGTWSAISTTNAPSSRGGHSAIWTGNEMIIWGGSNSSTTFNDGYKYNPVTDTWSTLSSVNAPPKRTVHGVEWTGTEMLVWGGFDFSPVVYLNDGGIYNPTTDSWETINNLGAPTGRIGGTTTWTGTHMIVFGGFNISTPDNKFYELSSDTWTLVSDTNAPSTRSVHTAIWTGSKLIIWGGNIAGGNVTNTGGILDPFIPDGYGPQTTKEYYLYRKS